MHIPMRILVAAPDLSLDQAGDASVLSFLGHDWLLTGIPDSSFSVAPEAYASCPLCQAQIPRASPGWHRGLTVGIGGKRREKRESLRTVP